MKVIGYSRQLSVFPGDDVDFLVSCDSEQYHADIVKLIHGDTNPDGPGLKIEPVQTGIDADFPGRVQRVVSGSHIEVPDHPKLRPGTEWTLQVMVAPTTPGGGVQGLVTKWDQSREAGHGLFIGEDGALQVWVGDGAGNVQRTSAGVPLLAGVWYLAVANQAADGAVTISQTPVVTVTNSRFAFASSWESTTATVTEPCPVRAPEDLAVPLVMAGYVSTTVGEGARQVIGGHLNGKLDRPRIHAVALGPERAEGAVENPRGNDLVAAWNFQEEITRDGITRTRHVTDVSLNRLHGRTWNGPARGMTGYNWQAQGAELRPRPRAVRRDPLSRRRSDRRRLGRRFHPDRPRRPAVRAVRSTVAGRWRRRPRAVLRARATWGREEDRLPRPYRELHGLCE